MNYNLMQDKLFEFSRKETLVYKFLQTCAYLCETNEEEVSFLNFPSKEDCEAALEDKCLNVRCLIENHEHSTPDYIFDLEKEVSVILFFREELIRTMSEELDWNMGLSGYESDNYPLKHTIETELKDIEIDEESSFLRNVYVNICSKNNIMKTFTSTMFLNGMTSREYINEFDYEVLTDYIPEMIILYYWINKFNETQDVYYIKKIDGTSDLDMYVDEEVSENTVRDYIGDFIEKTIINNSTFIRQMMTSMINNGREQNKLRK